MIALADFAVRNDLEIGSSDHEYAQFFAGSPAHAEEMRSAARATNSSRRIGHWAFLSLTGKAGPFHFPGRDRRTGGRQPTATRHGRGSAPSRRRLSPPTVPWAYASTFAWRPWRSRRPMSRRGSGAVFAWTKGVAGVSLLARTRSFVESQVVSADGQPDGRHAPVRRACAARPAGDSHVGRARCRRASGSTICPSCGSAFWSLFRRRDDRREQGRSGPGHRAPEDSSAAT